MVKEINRWSFGQGVLYRVRSRAVGRCYGGCYCWAISDTSWSLWWCLAEEKWEVFIVGVHHMLLKGLGVLFIVSNASGFASCLIFYLILSDDTVVNNAFFKV